MGWFGKLPITHVMFIYSSQIAGSPKTISEDYAFRPGPLTYREMYIYIYKCMSYTSFI